ncbi:unnamed protein product [Mytilus coruscus]|uniref:Uncharacterized protein n=1 Tax=Mytilus coruscus TaxID=42192 RepID=A0A6J8B7B5_MYTCO|nr:unnamed protein product [Mytilus coruscus]
MEKSQLPMMFQISAIPGPVCYDIILTGHDVRCVPKAVKFECELNDYDEAKSATHNESKALYHYIWQNIVGYEEHVNTLRMMNTVRDNLQSDENWTTITSGSFGEGLEMRGSDLDIMKVFTFIEICEDTHIDLNHDKVHFLHTRNMTMVQLWRFLLLDLVIFDKHSISLIPDELQREVKLPIPPVVYAHLLCFLCHFHLNNSGQCWHSLRNLELTIEDTHIVATRVLKLECYTFLGISFQLVGDKESARQAFIQSTELFPDQENNIAFKMLSLIS